MRYECDVLIIGSGAGGATTAAILAEAGLDVIVVEEGPWVEQGSVVPFSLEQMDRQYRSGGVTVALGLPSIAYTEGRCAGGGTEVNSGLYRRPPAETLDRWRRDYSIDDFATGRHRSDLRRGRVGAERADRARRAHRGRARSCASAPSGMGWRHDEIPRWMTYPERGNAVDGKRQSMTETYLPAGPAGRGPRARRASSRSPRRRGRAGDVTPN